MTNTDRIRYITAGLAIAGTVLAIGSTLTGIPGLPGWLVSSWPIVYGVALAFDRVAHILWPDVSPPTAPALPMTRPTMTSAQWDALNRDVHTAATTIMPEPVSLSSDVLHETPDRPRVGQVIDPHDTANAILNAQLPPK